MRFACLGSGSRGNALVVEQGQTRILIDCGFSLRETERRLARLGLEARQLSGVLLTHEHADHAQGVARLARRHAIPVWTTRGTWASLADVEVPVVNFFDCHQSFAIGDLEVQPFPVPHDAREPAQFRLGNGAVCLGLLTDTGYPTPHVLRQLDACDALVLECNHDEPLLAAGDYPPQLKRRVGGRFGHLSNRQAAELLGGLDRGRLRHVVAAHLSEKNNTPQLARQALASVLGCTDDWIAVAEQDAGLDWRQL